MADMLREVSIKKKEALTLILVFVVVLVVSAGVAYLLTGNGSQPERVTPVVEQPREETAAALATPAQPAITPTPRAGESFFDDLFGSPQARADIEGDNWGEVMAQIALRLVVAALFGAILAFRPRRPFRLMKPNPYVAQTQILLAVVAAALMIVVGDSAARAFGIFAAASLVRFRTNIRDPKEITVLLISLGVGLGAGVGRWDLALVLTVFSLVVLWLLENREPDQVLRALELKLETRDLGRTREILRQVLDKHKFPSELRTMQRANGDEALGTLVYTMDVSPMITTDELSEEIMALDSKNVESIEWTQKKSFSYLYQ
ncbi:MAG TPA: DUF4956 domain-containing protein [Pyrinomonadaceae bacterium]|nr:DUF4956 domain-containing protein [Pyrinomonadaceae bacterium]